MKKLAVLITMLGTATIADAREASNYTVVNGVGGGKVSARLLGGGGAASGPAYVNIGNAKICCNVVGSVVSAVKGNGFLAVGSGAVLTFLLKGGGVGECMSDTAINGAVWVAKSQMQGQENPNCFKKGGSFQAKEQGFEIYDN